ncbi:DUF7079 family protein [Chryseobacterium sp. CT-SW4]|uniref:DUF7079 family protein n=1 Tax=Chryseobacterium sp. SW-1 TaxID=3157343 RepID=UPI003B025473
MMKPINIEERKSVWIALSEFYLDTELQDCNFNYIAMVFSESSFSLEEIKNINKYEVFPVLQDNLLDNAGEWTGFEEEWLITTITSKLTKRTHLDNLLIDFNYSKYKWMCADYWLAVENIYHKIRNEQQIEI